jgi:hypothetical protein
MTKRKIKNRLIREEFHKSKGHDVYAKEWKLIHSFLSDLSKVDINTPTQVRTNLISTAYEVSKSRYLRWLPADEREIFINNIDCKDKTLETAVRAALKHPQLTRISRSEVGIKREPSHAVTPLFPVDPLAYPKIDNSLVIKRSK